MKHLYLFSITKTQFFSLLLSLVFSFISAKSMAGSVIHATAVPGNSFNNCDINNGSLTITATGGDGTGNYYFLVTGPDTVTVLGTSPATINGLKAGAYSILVGDAATLGSGSLDQSFTTFGNNEGPLNSFDGAWQSFTAGKTGLLSAIDIGFSNAGSNSNVVSGTGTLSVYAGTGIGGTLLATQPMPISYNYTVTVYMDSCHLNTPVPVVSGQTYTFYVQPGGVSGSLWLATGMSYAGICELVYHGNGSTFNYQWDFKTYVSNTAAPDGYETTTSATILATNTCSTIVASATSANASTSCSSDGKLTITATGGDYLGAYHVVITGPTNATADGHSPIVINGLKSGNYTINVYDSTSTSGTDGYSASFTKTVNATGQDTVSITAPSAICSNTADTLNTVQGYSTYVWNSNGNVSLSNSGAYRQPVIFGAAGSANIYVTVTDGSGCSYTGHVAVTVSPLPSPGIITANPNALCSGNSSQLAATGSSGNIQWQSSADGLAFANIPGAQTTSYNTPFLSQTAAYRVVVANGNCTNTSPIFTLVVIPSPATPGISTNDSLICSSDSTRLSATGSNYTSYHWNDGDTSNYTFVNAAGNYRVTVTNASGCSAVSNDQSISVYPVESVSISILGDTLTSFNSHFYQWFVNDSVIQGATNAVYVAPHSGSYSVEVIDSNGCQTTSNAVSIGLNGITTLAENAQFSIYPNPFGSFIYIRVNGASALIDSVEIYDVLGRIAASKKLKNTSGDIVTMEVPDIAVGIYYVKVRTNGSDFITKMIRL